MQKSTKKNVVLTFILLIAVLSVMVYKIALPKYLPLAYETEITTFSEVHNLDKDFVCAVIYTESKFQKEAVSSAGAVGLMQIIPETGEWVQGHLGLPIEDLDLTDPAQNINIGCWYLQWLMEKFDNNYTLVLAGYNAGHNKVAQWLENDEYSYDGTNLDAIPFPETDRYVKKVQFLQLLYDLCY
ncbi:MAG: lytic transglycosylase domain-containing protein [Bacillota bacterium]